MCMESRALRGNSRTSVKKAVTASQADTRRAGESAVVASAAALPDSILDDGEVAKRKMLLAELQAAMEVSGIRSVVTGNHRLVLRYNEPGPQPSGPTDPELRVLAPASTVTTDGSTYRLRDGRTFPVSDKPAAVLAIRA